MRFVPAAKEALRKWSTTYGFEEVCKAIVDTANSLIRKGLYTDQEERNGAFWNLGKICSVTQADQKDPGIGRLFYIRGILRNRCQYLSDTASMQLLVQAREAGVDVEDMVEFAKRVSSWSQFENAVLQEIKNSYAEQEEATDGAST